jgi:hypothetical protein
MPEAISKFLEFISKYSWAVAITTGVLVFIPSGAKNEIGIEEMFEAYKGFIWILFILSSVLFLGFLGDKSFGVFAKYRRKRKRINILRSRIQSLSDGEHKTIAYCLLKNTQSFRGKYDNSDAASLVQRGFASRGSGNVLDVGYLFHDDVWKVLKENETEIISSYEAPADVLIQDLEYYMNQQNSFGY